MEKGEIIGNITLTDAKITLPVNLLDLICDLIKVINAKAEIMIDFCETNDRNYCEMIFSLVDETGKKIKEIATVKMPSANLAVLCATWMQIIENKKNKII